MALDPSIPLKANTSIDTASPLLKAGLIRHKLQQQEIDNDRQAKADQRTEETHAQNMEANKWKIAADKISILPEREKARYQSIIPAAAELGTYLESGNVAGGIKYLENRRKMLGQQIVDGLDVDTTETDEALNILRNGKPEEIETLKGQMGQMTQLGQHMGILTSPKASSASSGIGKIQDDYNKGLIPKEVYDAVVKKESGQAKPMPATALKMQNEDLDLIGTMGNINADLGSFVDQLQAGTLDLGPVNNAWNAARNWSGNSTEESRALSSFQSTLEKLRNDSLRLNKGVQTEGDAQRAWNELLKNINDNDLVAQRLKEIKEINARAADLKKLNVDNVRANYGLDPYDFSQYEGMKSVIGNKESRTQPAQNGARRTSSGIEYTVE